MPHKRRPSGPWRRRGFTLVELLISIAIVLVLILGINEVFGLTSRTVGAGLALSDALRSNRAAQEVINDDFRMAVPMAETPCLIISSGLVHTGAPGAVSNGAFRNIEDLRGDRDGIATTIDLDGNGKEGEALVPGEIVKSTSYGYRNYRTDRVGFFIQGEIPRQTGTGAAFVDTVTAAPTVVGRTVPSAATEAWVVYGHLYLSNDAATPIYFAPGAGKPIPSPAGTYNARNYFASQWCLGRSVVLLNPSTTIPVGQDVLTIPSPTSQYGLLAVNAKAGSGVQIQESKCDVAQTSVAAYRDLLARTANTQGGPANYWTQMLVNNHFQADPTPLPPLTGPKVSQTVPCFVPGCSQIIVEYAGDFLAQDSKGKVITQMEMQGSTPTKVLAPPDGEVDFTIDPVTGVKRIRWYGFPRDINNDGTIDPSVDVVPLRDMIQNLGVVGRLNMIHPSGTPSAVDYYYFERNVDITLPYPPSPVDYAANPNQLWAASYVVAWGSEPQTVSSPRPSMLRITLQIDDPSGRLKVPQTAEYVVRLK